MKAHTQLKIAGAAMITLLSLSAAHAEPSQANGVRATLMGQGLSAWGYADNVGSSLILHQQMIAVPMVEMLLPIGAGEFLIGLSYARVGASRSYGSEQQADRSAYTLGLSAGFAAAVVHAGASTVRVGGRLGTAISNESVEFTYAGQSDTDDKNIEGVVIIADGFVSGEHMLSKHLGLQGEAGINLIHHTHDDDTRSWLGLYTALSGVIRF